MRTGFLIAALMLALAACTETPEELAPPGPPPPAAYPPSEFRAQDFAWSAEPGSASIEGDLAFRAGGVRYSCSGGDVILTPETPWSRRRMTILYGSASAADVAVSVVRAREPSGPRADYARYVKKATCDDQDHFSFEGLPAGGWFVITLAKPVNGPGEAVAVMRRVETRRSVRYITLN
ncbi:MAG TPA: hypothetical protein VGS12_03590 [Caulobacteraceae bacterium]|nr:hypothetical protein [Caulobacteraceae bacterium]